LLTACGGDSPVQTLPVSPPPEGSTEQPPNQQTGNEAAADVDVWIDFCFVGDVMMDSVIADYIREYGVDYPWTDVAPLFHEADITVANLETSVSTRGETKKPEGYGFRSHPDTLQGLINNGIDLVSLANNHSLDFGPIALADTTEALTRYGIAYTGAGANLAEAEKLAIIEKNNLRIGFLAYTSIIPDTRWHATENSPGIAPLRPEFYERILQTIEKANQNCDILVIMLHWGKEHSNQVENWQRELARQMIDSGADVIVGHHPHVLRAIEFYQNKPILYSTGNFVFLKRDDKAGQTAVFSLRMNKAGFVHGFISPVHIRYAKANLLDQSQALYPTIINEMTSLSKTLGTAFTKSGGFYPAID
jgi:poly-gamma-glutamate capsule biosynthesis protein CapA/YwtB (metallophosphatase superfamily)